MKPEFMNVLNVVALPTEVFADTNQVPRWRAPFALLVASSVVIGWFMIPAITEPLRRVYAHSFGESAAETTVSTMMRYFLLLEILVEPMFKLLRWIVFAGVLYLLVLTVTRDRRKLFSRLFAITAYSESIFVLMSTLTVLIIYARGLDHIEGSSDLTVFKGLDFFFPGEPSANLALTTLLTNVNIFSVWYIITVSAGIRLITGLNRFEAVGFATIAWLIWITLSIGQPSLVKVILGILV